MVVKNSFSYRLSGAQEAVLVDILKQGNYRPVAVEHTKIAVEAADCRIAVYATGQCLVQGKGAADFVLFVLEPLVLKSVHVGYDDIVDPEAFQPHMGIDESGKGDFFGPIVIAGAYVDASLVERMREMDVKESKRMTSDRKVLEMGRGLRKLLGKRYSIVKIGPRAYNRLYAKMRNVNTILAWGHARAVENLLEILPDCPRAVSDQFGSKKQVEGALMKRGRRIHLVQKHRAESDPAVAAASVIARESFVRSLRKMEDRYGISFPKGAGAGVRERGAELARKHTPAILLETAKCHFKTTDAILQALRIDRSALGPEGQQTSKPASARHSRSAQGGLSSAREG